ncbi:hypothetical protein SAMN05421809_3175 [Natronorubrum daqingense]|uniref:Uncharacterized protein n=1 Tax=Natronorubrum daqingense TaxID=588898 RepID=A0A1N7FFJ0_9EURY|nr:hypothetical protein SAMN05421809_3175 [Natronorubrum daqingense]
MALENPQQNEYLLLKFEPLRSHVGKLRYPNMHTKPVTPCAQ